MKKNNMLRIASVLLVAVLLSTCAISGAFAKYTTNGEASDEARVALFGVEVTAGDFDIFEKTYNAATDINGAGEGNGLAVEATVDVVAPGTSGTLAAMSITGTPEVAVEIEYTAEVTFEGWEVDENVYCPIVVTVGGEDIACDGDLDAFAAAIKEAIEEYTTILAPNTNLANANVAAPVVTWAWDFDANGAGTNDAKDTELAKAANYQNNTITLAITATVNQVD